MLLIVGCLVLTFGVIARHTGDVSMNSLTSNFIAGFYLIFSFFKALGLNGSADAYRSYDVVAQVSPAWGLAHPFFEPALGVADLPRIVPVATNIVTLTVTAADAAGA